MFDRFIFRLANSRFHLVIIAALILAVLLTIIIGVGSCGRDRTAEKQAEQTVASGQAASAAGANAVNVTNDVAASEAALDTSARATGEQIRNAKDADAIRRAVIDSLCKQDAHRFDPACRVR